MGWRTRERALLREARAHPGDPKSSSKSLRRRSRSSDGAGWPGWTELPVVMRSCAATHGTRQIYPPAPARPPRRHERYVRRPSFKRWPPASARGARKRSAPSAATGQATLGARGPSLLYCASAPTLPTAIPPVSQHRLRLPSLCIVEIAVPGIMGALSTVDPGANGCNE